MPTHDLYLPRTYSTWHPRRAVAPFTATFAVIRRWIERARQRRALAGLDDQMLRDIGITRAEAARECEKPFWR